MSGILVLWRLDCLVQHSHVFPHDSSHLLPILTPCISELPLYAISSVSWRVSCPVQAYVDRRVRENGHYRNTAAIVVILFSV